VTYRAWRSQTMCHSERMTDAELSRLSEICEAATPGPWEYDGQHFEIHAPHNDNYWVIVSEECDAPNDAPVDEFGHQYSPDYAFIAAARTAMPRLLAEVKALRRVADEAQDLVTILDLIRTETLWKKLLTTVNDLERAIATIDTD
jgi:hypothetical protein